MRGPRHEAGRRQRRARGRKARVGGHEAGEGLRKPASDSEGVWTFGNHWQTDSDFFCQCLDHHFLHVVAHPKRLLAAHTFLHTRAAPPPICSGCSATRSRAFNGQCLTAEAAPRSQLEHVARPRARSRCGAARALIVRGAPTSHLVARVAAGVAAIGSYRARRSTRDALWRPLRCTHGARVLCRAGRCRLTLVRVSCSSRGPRNKAS